MDLLDRYLQAVTKHLPWQRQDDIVAELRANLESQLEDKEAELGRPLTAPEVEAWLKQIGPPMQVAARYQPQQYLIGPSVFPTYIYVLKMACSWALIIYAIVNAVELMTAPQGVSAAIEALVRIPGVLFTVAAWVTLVFAGFEFAVARGIAKLAPGTCTPADWSPSALPPAEEMVAKLKKRRSHAQAVAEVVFGFLFLIWLLLIPQHPYLWLGPGALYFKASPYALAPVWMQFYWCVVALNALQLAWHSVDLWRGTWRRPQPVKKAVTGIFGLIPLAILLAERGQAYVVLKNPAMDHAYANMPLASINEWIFRIALLIFVIAVATLAWEIGKASVKAYRKRAA
jgi:hypothetical protein